MKETLRIGEDNRGGCVRESRMIREAAIRMRTRMPSVTSGPIPAAMLTSFERQRERIYQCRSKKLDSPDPRTTRSGEIGYVVFGNALAVLFPRTRRLPELSPPIGDGGYRSDGNVD
ncbi:hypothetical protein RRSWK_01197 [Rhodopirellula sp. SWK7]|nr:hypothetical protein RRSWK_01197 [Rhodopirellula sp. SWK7]